MSAPDFPKGIAPSTLKNLLKPLTAWSSGSSAETDLERIFGPRMDWTSAFKHLDSFRRADFSLLPPIRTLSATDMPGLWGGYSRDTREIYLSADCPQESLSAVLIEEIGHFLDQEICAEETPGEEGARFAAIVLGLTLAEDCRDDSLAPLFLEGRQLLVEAASKARGSFKSRSGRISRGKKRGSSKDGGSKQNGGPGYAEVGGKSSNPKLQENIIYATEDSARIPQKAARDRLIGSRGNDTFVVINEDVRIEDPNGGVDTVESSITFSLATHSGIEKLLLTGGANINGTGNLKANLISGNSGSNKLDGGTDSAIDTLQGGAGNDTYVLRDTLDKIVEGAGGGTDTIETTQSTFSIAQYASVENLAYSGTGTGVTFTGNTENNLLTGTAGADSLDGGTGADTLVGGAGSDTYRVDDTGDFIIENTNSGKDLVISTAATYVLRDNIESLALDGSSDISGTGNDAKNTISGNNANNILSGLGGDDYIVGDDQLPSISLIGRTVTDVAANYLIKGTNALVNNLGTPSSITNAGSFGERVVTRGDDNSSSAIDITPIFGPDGLNLYGKKIKNIFINTNGNITFDNALSTFNPQSIDAGLGTSIIAPFWADVDTRSGRSNVTPGGNSFGTNLIYWDVDDENRVLTITWDDVRYFGQQTTGITADTKVNAFQIQLIDSGGGNAFIVFRYENIDWTTGSASGGTNGLGGQAARAGFNTGQGVVIELPQSGDDLSMLDLDQKLPQGGLNTGQPGVYVFEIRNGSIVENFGGNDSLLGGAGNDTLLGNGGNDTLLGEAGDDSLDSGAGVDSMVGGAGNDTYLVDNSSDKVVESPDGGTDFVKTTISYNLGANIEIAQVIGLSNANLGGSDSDNTLIGNTGNNSLSGLGGADSLDGGGGADILDGGMGADTLDGGAADNVGDILRGGGGDDIYLIDSLLDTIDDFSGVDTVQSSVTFSLASTLVSGVENLSLVGGGNIDGFGNELANSLSGNSGNNFLDGGAGADTILGGSGSDTLNGGSQDAAADSLVGGADDDFYIIDSILDQISDESGSDTVFTTVSLTLQGGSGVENLILSQDLLGVSADISGTGNSLANSISGNAGNNSLDGGNDTAVDFLVGNGGSDTFFGSRSTLAGDYLRGGSGNDIYIVQTDKDIIGDVGGTDVVFAAASFNLGGSLVSGVEHLVYTGSTAATLSGNDFDNSLTSASTSADTLLGGAGSDTLSGGGGADSMVGGLGDDFYVVTSGSENIQELNGEGTDTAIIDISGPSVSHSLAVGSFIENIIYTGIGFANLSGSNTANTITGGDFGNSLSGNAGNDSLLGGAVSDTLEGGIGDDTLVGKAGADLLKGGEGNDYYILDSQFADDVEDISGNDTIESSVDFSLSFGSGFLSIENLVLSGSARSGTGNSSANILSGNTLANTLSGQVGNDTIYGKEGLDVLAGGDDNDLLFGGTNTLFGGTDSDASADQLNGGSGSDSLDAGGGNDILYGGAGTDTLFGGTGNDLLLGDTNLSPGASVDVPSNDSLSGGDGNDTLDGGGGTDSLIGGKGDDLIYIRSTNDVVRENIGEGYDTLIANININLLSVAYANFEAVALYGTGSNTVGGNASSNIIYGNVGNNILAGLLGNDSLYGGAGLDSLDAGDGNDYLEGGVSAVLDEGDTMNGGKGNDTFIVYNRYDRIFEDTLPGSAEDVDTVYTYVNFDPLANEDTNNVTRSKSFASSDTLFFAQLDNFVFMGDVIRGVGNAKDNSFTGNYENNVILGLAGHDTIIGNGGNDSLYGDRDRSSLSGDPTLGYDSGSGTYPFNPGDYVSNDTLLVGDFDPIVGRDYLDGGEGDDLLSGNLGNDILIGGSGNDILFGGADIDSMVGGIGNDTLYIDSEEDIMVENANEGTDFVFSSANIHLLQDNIENVVIYGPGVNFAVGNSVDNIMYVGQFGGINPVTLSGGAGNDQLYGYFAGKIYGYAEIAPDFNQMPNRDEDDYINGGFGNDYIDGGFGVDTLEGGLGNDTLVVNSTRDRSVGGNYDHILEFGYEGDPTNGGIDWVICQTDFIDLKDVYTDNDLSTQLEYVQNGMFIENLQGSGTLSGNWLNNTIFGGEFNDSLNGEFGNDFLCGLWAAVGDSRTSGGGRDTLTGAIQTDVAENNTFSLVGSDGNSLYLDGGTLNNPDFIAGVLDASFALITDAGTVIREKESNLANINPNNLIDPSYITRTANYTVGGTTYLDMTWLYAVDGTAYDLIAISRSATFKEI